MDEGPRCPVAHRFGAAAGHDIEIANAGELIHPRR